MQVDDISKQVPQRQVHAATLLPHCQTGAAQHLFARLHTKLPGTVRAPHYEGVAQPCIRGGLRRQHLRQQPAVVLRTLCTAASGAAAARAAVWWGAACLCALRCCDMSAEVCAAVRMQVYWLVCMCWVLLPGALSCGWPCAAAVPVGARAWRGARQLRAAIESSLSGNMCQCVLIHQVLERTSRSKAIAARIHRQKSLPTGHHVPRESGLAHCTYIRLFQRLRLQQVFSKEASSVKALRVAAHTAVDDKALPEKL